MSKDKGNYKPSKYEPKADYKFMPGDVVRVQDIPPKDGNDQAENYVGVVIGNPESKGGQVGFCVVLLTSPSNLDPEINYETVISIPVSKLTIEEKPEAEFTYDDLFDAETRH